MLQVYGNWTDPNKTADHESTPIMSKPVIFQLYDIENNDINFELLESIADFLINPMYSKVFHNYSIDAHTINNALRKIYPDNVSMQRPQGFAADSMHMTRLLDAGSPENSLKALSVKYNPDGTVKAQTLREFAQTTFDQEMLPARIQDAMVCFVLFCFM